MFKKELGFSFCLIVLLLFLPEEAHSSQIANHTHSKIQKLSTESAWKKLLHYQKNGNQWVSLATNQEFFVSARGKTEPLEELNKTLSLLLSSETTESIQCQFPARTKWLRTKLNLELPKISCTKLEQWINQFNTNTLTINFAANYLDSPASIFGHTFLQVPHAKFNNQLLSYSFNYAADVAGSENGIAYLFNGLVGNFPNKVDTIAYHRRLKTYSEIEGRDIWQYPLNLTPNEIETIVLHLWEIKDNVFDYFFLDENCSYQTLAVINVAKPKLDLTDDFVLYAIPADTLKVLKANELLGTAVYVESKDKRIEKMMHALTQRERELVFDIVNRKIKFDSRLLSQFSNASLTKVVDAVYEYTSVRISRGEIIAEQNEELISALLVWKQNNKSIPKQPAENAEYEPTIGHNSKRVSIAGGYSDNGNFLNIEYRGAFHDYLDPIIGYDKGLGLSLFDIEYKIHSSSHGTLTRFELINISSRAAPGYLSSNDSWKFRVTREQKSLDNIKPLVNSLEYQRGQSYDLWGQQLSYFVGISADNSKYLDNDFGVEMQAQVEIGKQSPSFSYLFSYQYGKFVSGSSSQRDRVELSTAFFPHRNFRYLAKISRDDNGTISNNQIQVGMSFYF